MTHKILEERSIITVDCHEMFPPEPMVKVLEAVEAMQPHEAVLMLHRHKPIHLFPKLAERQLEFHVTEHDDESIELLIWREN
ncbi:MAG: DUF2249 domain-containing protein [SAR324 cluster bacterium]|nr:DUF2249 domain-containing protein [SAR324 cluster bacterium]